MKQNITKNVQSELFALPDAKPVLNAGAEFSDCGLYRYKLWRIWDESLPLAMCIGLNPSTANAVKADPTITNLTKMLKLLGYGGFYMMNLFGLVTAYPKELIKHADPVGENDKWLKEAQGKCSDVIFAWGAFVQARERAKAVINLFPGAHCLGKNKDGSPKHPLYIPANIIRIQF